jgi:Glycosyl hydrolase family 115
MFTTSLPLTVFCWISTALAIGQQAVISFTGGALQIAGGSSVASLFLGSADFAGVIRAGQDLSADFGRVTGKNLTVVTKDQTSTDTSPSSGPVIIAGTIGKSTLIDSLVSASKIDVSTIKGQWESFQTQIVANPMTGLASALVIAGSDKRGTIYGIYDISEQIGVSPWYWFADVATTQQANIYALDVHKIQGSPSVRYRGIFLNDEQPALTNWVKEKYGGVGYVSGFYSRVFELLLRLRANYLWPTMWDSMFALDDTKNQPLADTYGIVMGTSHTEPLMRSTKEQGKYCSGSWDWTSNKANIISFLTDGAKRAKPYESLYTMGMRGSGDTASSTLNAAALEDVVAEQQKILTSVVNSNLSAIPQMWCLYKEVGGYYQKGLKVPDDITLLWSDDNVGNMQRLPIPSEVDRSGGAGVYYHFDYVGDPRNYKWINTILPQKTWEQMHLTYSRNARQIWIVNVGDLKPLVYLLSPSPSWTSH